MKTYHVGPGYYDSLVYDLMAARTVHTGEWQAMDTSSSQLHATHELEDVTIVIDQLPKSSTGLANVIPHVDEQWASEHFWERVSGHPHNPAPSAVRWPYAVRANGDHTDDAGTYDHTYPERFWPKHAGHRHRAEWTSHENLDDICGGTPGIRFHYGDLDDVVLLLARSPLTRQAFLPVWFPEDTGAVDGQRVPCTLGYHFMIRGGKLSVRYYIRSCDIYRHLSNDLYLAGRLAQWMVKRVNARTNLEFGVDDPGGFEVGKLVMHITSLHMFVADRAKMKARLL